MAIGDEIADPGFAQQRLDAADEHDVVGSNQFQHAMLPPQCDETARCKFVWPGASTAALERESQMGLPMGVVVSLAESEHRKSPAPRGVDPLVALTLDDMARVNEAILARTGSEVTMIPEVANHLINSGGKRLRPMLTLAGAVLTGYRGDGHVKLAASVEFMHTATLLHDDVVDESAMRRGKPAARMLWGNEASVLVGDFLLGQAFRMMVEVGSLPCLDVLSHAAAVIAEGEVMQLAAAKNIETTEDDYLAVIRAKTAALFAAAAEVGPLLGDRPKAEIAALRSYGLNLGIAFQLVDDVLDYGGASARLGKNVGDDFREGKITLPVVLSLRRGSDEERAFWKRSLEQGENDDAALASAIAIMKRHRALESTAERAGHYGAIAKDALGIFPASLMKSALMDVVDFCLSRAH
jgi:octaprenyl-diphosphate synthase